MMDIICNCGHAMSEHEVVYGCLHELENGATCHCGNEPTYIANDKLAALLSAGNAMAKRLSSDRGFDQDYDIENDLIALAAWEQVTKQ
jgi:hypothetical protein